MTCLPLTTSDLNNDLKTRHLSNLQNNLSNLKYNRTYKNYIMWTFVTKYTYTQRFVTSPQLHQTNKIINIINYQ